MYQWLAPTVRLCHAPLGSPSKASQLKARKE